MVGHKAEEHRSNRCSICKENFENAGKLGRHKIEVHGYTAKQLGWGRGGWNKGMSQAQAFNAKEKAHHGSPEFMKNLNSPAFMKTKMIAREYHEAVVVQKEKELRTLGYRTFNTSNYANHYRVPDIIAISPDGKVVAVEME